MSANTYVDHPFAGYDHLSIDFWGSNGRGWAIAPDTGRRIWRYLNDRREELRIRHIIFEDQWWHYQAGMRPWWPDDHSGRLRHVHVTLLP